MYQTFKVHMLANQPEHAVRLVNVPQAEVDGAQNLYHLAELVLRYGQNDFAEGPDAEQTMRSRCSVSIGDVFEVSDGCWLLYMVLDDPKMLTHSEFEAYKAMRRRDRCDVYCPRRASRTA